MKLDATKMKDWQIAEAAEEQMKPVSQLAEEMGLEADELVVVKGVQRAIPGAKVDPQQAEPGKTSRPVAKEETDGDNDLSQVDKLKEKVSVLQTQLSDIQAELDSTVNSKTQP